MEDLGLTLVQMSAVFSAFTLAYSLFEVPSGWLGDVIGPRRVLTRIVLWWSAFTMLTGAAQGLRSLVVDPLPVRRRRGRRLSQRRAQLLAVVPGARARHGQRRAVLRLAPGRRDHRADRARADPAWGWRASFVAFGAVGIVWAVGLVPLVSRSPRGAPGRRRGGARVDPAEHSDDQLRTPEKPNGPTPERTPWRRLLTSPNLYAICAMYFAFGYGLYFYFTWLPTYLIRELRLLAARPADSSRRCRFCWPAPRTSPAAGAPIRWRAREASARRASRSGSPRSRPARC